MLIYWVNQYKKNKFGTILDFDNNIHYKVDKKTVCDKYVTEFRKNVTRDFPVWNQHRYVEIYESGDIIGVSVNIKEKWIQFYKNGILQYHLDHIFIYCCTSKFVFCV